MRLLLSDCAAGLYQQMYFLGKDIIHGDGNHLVRFGLERTPCRGTGGTSCYGLEGADSTIEFHGSCACCYTESSAVAFIRTRSRFYEWLPEERCTPGLWAEKDIGNGNPKTLFTGVAPLLRWWLDYERWIDAELGPAYREGCFREWRRVNKKKSWLPPQDAVRWIDRFLAKGCKHARPKRSDREPATTHS